MLRTVLGFDCTSDQTLCHKRCRCSVNGMQVLKAVVLALLYSSIAAQLSDPIAGDHQVKSHKNKFLKRAAAQDENRVLRCDEPQAH